MKIGIIGLGKMGLNFAFNLMDKDYDVVGYDIKRPEEKFLFKFTEDLEDLISKLPVPRKIVMMLPAGEATNETVMILSKILDENDILIDAGNSYYQDSLMNYEIMKKHNIGYLDCGTSGGIEGARFGACLMVGGEKNVFDQVECIFNDLSIEEGYSYVGQPGSGHFSKMVHNGIEYGMMQSIAEGLNIIHQSRFNIDLENITNVWNHGSIIESYLMKITHEIFSEGADLTTIHKRIDSSGEGKWTLMEALNLGVSTPTISAAMNVRNMSSDEDSINNQVIAAMRNKFGGHYIHKENIDE